MVARRPPSSSSGCGAAAGPLSHVRRRVGSASVNLSGLTDIAGITSGLPGLISPLNSGLNDISSGPLGLTTVVNPASILAAPHVQPASITGAQMVRIVDEELRKICIQAKESVVMIEYKHKNGDLIKAYMEAVWESKKKPKVQVRMGYIEEQLALDTRHCSGFFIGEDSGDPLILSCSHAVEHCYNKDFPISKTKIHELFKVSFTCDHLEEDYRRKNGQGKGNAKRRFILANVVEVDSIKDLLLLRIDKKSLTRICKKSHPPLKIAQALPEPLETVLMVSWPCFRHMTMCKGALSYPVRGMDEIDKENMNGYDLTGVEVNITAEVGSSGAPLLNLNAQYIGVLNAGRVDCYNYYTSLQDIKSTFSTWGVDKVTAPASQP